MRLHGSSAGKCSTLPIRHNTQHTTSMTLLARLLTFGAEAECSSTSGELQNWLPVQLTVCLCFVQDSLLHRGQTDAQTETLEQSIAESPQCLLPLQDRLFYTPILYTSSHCNHINICSIHQFYTPVPTVITSRYVLYTSSHCNHINICSIHQFYTPVPTVITSIYVLYTSSIHQFPL
jgi:hypothetical protein